MVNEDDGSARPAPADADAADLRARVDGDFLARVRGIRARTEAATAEDVAAIGQLEQGKALAELARRVVKLEELLAETHATVEQLVMWVTPLKGGTLAEPGQLRPPGAPVNDW